jgi:hypothetical protein
VMEATELAPPLPVAETAQGLLMTRNQWVKTPPNTSRSQPISGTQKIFGVTGQSAGLV